MAKQVRPSRMVDEGIQEIRKTFDLGEEPTKEEIEEIEEILDGQRVIEFDDSVIPKPKT